MVSLLLLKYDIWELVDYTTLHWGNDKMVGHDSISHTAEFSWYDKIQHKQITNTVKNIDVIFRTGLILVLGSKYWTQRKWYYCWIFWSQCVNV